MLIIACIELSIFMCDRLIDMPARRRLVSECDRAGQREVMDKKLCQWVRQTTSCRFISWKSCVFVGAGAFGRQPSRRRRRCQWRCYWNDHKRAHLDLQIVKALRYNSLFLFSVRSSIGITAYDERKNQRIKNKHWTWLKHESLCRHHQPFACLLAAMAYVQYILRKSLRVCIWFYIHK